MRRVRKLNLRTPRPLQGCFARLRDGGRLAGQAALPLTTLACARRRTEAPTAAPPSGTSTNGIGSCPELLWQLVTGRLSYVLPAASEYCVGSPSVPQAPALRALRGECWGALLDALPQVVVGGDGAEEVGSNAAAGDDVARGGASVLVEYVYCDDYFERGANKGAVHGLASEEVEGGDRD